MVNKLFIYQEDLARLFKGENMRILLLLFLMGCATDGLEPFAEKVKHMPIYETPQEAKEYMERVSSYTFDCEWAKKYETQDYIRCVRVK